MSTILYERKNGSTFSGPLHNPQMQIASVIDPMDGKVKYFETQFAEDRTPLKRVEIDEDQVL